MLSQFHQVAEVVLESIFFQHPRFCERRQSSCQLGLAMEFEDRFRHGIHIAIAHHDAASLDRFGRSASAFERDHRRSRSHRLVDDAWKWILARSQDKYVCGEKKRGGGVLLAGKM